MRWGVLFSDSKRLQRMPNAPSRCLSQAGLARSLGLMQQLMMERPKVAALATASVLLLALKPFWKWLREAQVERFQKVPGMPFFGVYF